MKTKTAGKTMENQRGKYRITYLPRWDTWVWVCSCTILRCRHAITAPHLDSITPRHDMLKTVKNLQVTAEDQRER